MSAALRNPTTLAEFLAREERQELRYEFDGFVPVAMTGGTIAPDRITASRPSRRQFCANDPDRATRGRAGADLTFVQPSEKIHKLSKSPLKSPELANAGNANWQSPGANRHHANLFFTPLTHGCYVFSA